MSNVNSVFNIILFPESIGLKFIVPTYLQKQFISIQKLATILYLLNLFTINYSINNYPIHICHSPSRWVYILANKTVLFFHYVSVFYGNPLYLSFLNSINRSFVDQWFTLMQAMFSAELTIVFLANLRETDTRFDESQSNPASSHHYCSPNHFICSYCFLFAGLTDPELIHNCTYQFSIRGGLSLRTCTQRQRRMKDR